MLFKTPKIEKDYTQQQRRTKLNKCLRMYLSVLDMISIMVGAGEILITDFLRTGDKWIHSLHHERYGGRAADIRVRDKSLAWYIMMVAIGKAIELFNSDFRMNPHFELYGTDDQHIHVEVRGLDKEAA